MIPQTSKVKEIRDLDLTEDPINLDLDFSKPLSTIDDPHQIVPHEHIPDKIKRIIVGMYNEEYFYENEWSVQKLNRLSKAMSHPRENVVNSLAQICSPNCPFLDICPYDIIGKAPVGERCIIELRNSKKLFQGYLEAVSERLAVDKEDLIDDMIVHNMIMGIVEADIVSNRANSIIAREGIIQQDPAAVDAESGRVWYKNEEAAAIKIKERIDKKKDALFKQLLATPEMEAKYKGKKTNEAFQRINDVLDRITAIIDDPDVGKIKDADIIDSE